ncbi:MAG: hypothetical protein IPL78_25985 [Chloroflexi bacterium]|nr:hypothetical protein [Chloroflexota bacterium]
MPGTRREALVLRSAPPRARYGTTQPSPIRARARGREALVLRSVLPRARHGTTKPSPITCLARGREALVLRSVLPRARHGTQALPYSSSGTGLQGVGIEKRSAPCQARNHQALAHSCLARG